MSEVKKTTFNGEEVEIEDMPLNKCDNIWPYIMSWQLQIAIGNWNFLQDCTAEQVRFFQKLVCENVYRFKDEEKEGVTTKVRVNLSYLDLNDSKKDFICLLLELLEHNFGFFLGSRKILKLLTNSRTSEAINS